MRFVFIALAGVISVAAVAATVSTDLTDKETSAARKLYVSKCAKCHRFYEPRDYSGSEWDRWMTSMSRKSKLKPEQEQLLTRYLQAYREGKIPAPR